MHVHVYLQFMMVYDVAYRRGCALSQLGNVFVENLVWTKARYVSNFGD